MKKIIFAVSVLFLIAAACNSNRQSDNTIPVVMTTPTPTTSTTPSKAPTATPTAPLTSTPIPLPTASNPNSKIYIDSNFTFEYPKTWSVSATGNPAKNPTGCGNAWGNAVSCVSLDPQELVKNLASTVFVAIFKTPVSPLAWCQSLSDDRFGNCKAVTINGYTAATATSRDGDYPLTEYSIVSHNGTMIMFQIHNLTYQLGYDTAVNSIKFTK